MVGRSSLTVSATEFEAHCLELLDSVEASGETITITKRGKPVARLVPLAPKSTSFFGSLPVTIVGDIVGPIGEHWDAER